jgi:uncharacterized protein DUF3597
MSIFGSILDRIFHHGTAGTAQAASPQQSGTGTASAQGSQTSSQQSQAPSAATATGAQRLQSVDVEAVLSQLASKKGGGGNWRTSIVDLLKLLDLDSSLAARKTLAGELNVHAGADGTAEQNIALQKAVMSKLAENGGKVPDSLRH